MNVKKAAARGMVIFLCVVALCMFFGRTLQSLTTPKVRFTQSTTGKLSKSWSLEASVHFSKEEDVYETVAQEYPLTIRRVYAEENASVAAGDLIMTAVVTGKSEKMEEYRASYKAKAEELTSLDVENRRNPTETERNKRYTALIDAMQVLSDKRVACRAQGLESDAWAAEEQAYEEAKEAFYDTYLYSSLAVTDEVFSYVEKRSTLVTEMEELEEKMTALEQASTGVKEIRAKRDGVITSISLKSGDSYTGDTPLYSMADADTAPTLRAYTDERFAVDTKATVKGDWDEQQTVVTQTGKDSDGKKYVDFELNDKILNAYDGLSGLIKQGSVKISISSRASVSATLINASALRESDGETYVYVAEYVDGGLLGGYYQVKKVTVTVLDKSDKQVSVAESLGSYQLIDREDRSIQENSRVMEQSS